MTSFIHDTPPLDVCVEVLAAAFADDPAVVHFCGDDPGRRAAWFNALLRMHETLDGRRLLIINDAGPIGVAVAIAPHAKPSAAAQLAWTAQTLRRCGPRALVRTLMYLHGTEPWKQDRAWTLQFLGVLPEARRAGVAGQLSERAQAEYPDSPAFLTTANPQNVELYEKWGFRVFLRVALNGIAAVGMSRPSPSETSRPDGRESTHGLQGTPHRTTQREGR